MAYGTVNADVIQTSTSGGILGAGNASIMKNRIINGAMVIDQRNAGASYAQINSNYSLDRWCGNSYDSGNVTGKYTVQQNAGSVTPPVGFANYFGVTSSASTSVGSTGIYTIFQPIEGYNIADLNWGSANAKTITISFWVRSSLTGTFGGAIQNADTSRSYPFTYTISAANTWEQKSVTIAGDTTGTWLTTNGVGAYIRLGLGVGTTYSGTAGSWSSGNYYGATGATSVVGTSGATFYITGVQLEVGSNATGFEYVNYQTSLANCQRYYQSFVFASSNCMSMGCATSTTAAQSPMYFLQTMRTSPTVTLPTCGNGANQITFLTGSGNYPSGFGTNTAATIGTTSFTVIGNGYTGFTAGQAAILYSSDGNATITASAEL